MVTSADAREMKGLGIRANKTPAEVAGIKIEGQNKWITVIQNASKNDKLL
jgi:hypothetical protein